MYNLIMKFSLSSDLLKKFPGMSFAFSVVKNARIIGPNEETNKILTDAYPEIVKRFNLEQLANHPHSQAYVQFAKNLGVSHKSAFLPHLQIKRVYKGKGVGNINNIVNEYMALELLYNLSFSAYDLSTLKGDIVAGLSKGGEQIALIGGDKVTIKSGDLIISDSDGPFYSFSEGYRGSSKITSKTEDVLFLIDAPEGVKKETVDSAIRELLAKFNSDYFFVLDSNETMKTVMID